MNLDEIDKKCFILALFIRDDGQRFLLGSGAYEFKDSQLHFSANTMSNDVVEVQGNDGYLLAGQVRRPTTQVFDGYIGDASINKPDIEGYRRDFFAFFQKNHFYTVVYIFPDGTAIQRRRGFIVDAGEVRELYQMFPEYHIGLNFEDVNYYKYSEDEDGNEQYAKSIDINISKAVSGGLIWDEVSQEQAYNHGTDFSISGTIEDEPVDHIDLYGDIMQQTYSGKNLFNKDNVSYMGGYFEIGGSISTSSSSRNRVLWIPCEANTTYSLTKATGTWSGGSWILGVCHETPAAGVSVYNAVGIGKSTTYNGYTTDSSSTYLVLRCQNSDSTTYGWDVQVGDTGLTVWQTVLAGLQFEKSSTATSFEPYVGGTASPNPDYPQEVQTVTGEQTITISDGNGQSQSYTVDLGDIELCKIGDYQDYIYKSGEDWYLHKETGKVTFTGAVAETWSSATAATGYVRFSTASGATHADNTGYCNELINRGSQSHGAYEYVWVQPNANAFYIQVLNTRANDLAGFRTWLGANPATVYYDISTPTDTKITNADLIAQLEALNSATTYAGVTWFKTESENLPADTWAYVQIQAGGGVVWDNYGATWEEGGGGMIVNVNVDSIENVYPVWTVNGPTDTPILTNLTTGTSITYNGNITASQTLVVDMLNQTALLNGTSVIGKLSGDWIELAPGMNRMSYTATNEQTAPKSTLEWQEIVG